MYLITNRLQSGLHDVLKLKQVSFCEPSILIECHCPYVCLVQNRYRITGSCIYLFWNIGIDNFETLQGIYYKIHLMYDLCSNISAHIDVNVIGSNSSKLSGNVCMTKHLMQWNNLWNELNNTICIK